MANKTHSSSPIGMLPSGLAAAYEERSRARTRSSELRQVYEDLANDVAREDKLNDNEMPGETRAASYILAKLGIELATQEQEAVRLDKEVVKAKQAAGFLGPNAAEKLIRKLSRRHISLGDELWRNHKKKMRLEEPSTVPLADVRGDGLAEGLLALYGKSDPVKARRRQRRIWREDALDFYGGRSWDHRQKTNNDENSILWCHVTGKWWPNVYVKVAHIVPFSLDMDSVGNLLFGSQVDSLDRAGNSLLLSVQVKCWFDTHHLVIVPADPTEMPIKRWRTDIISPGIKNAEYINGSHTSEFDGKELIFRNDKRPVSRFMYFRFIMALVRIKDVNRPGWQDAWAKYYEQRPFPTPGPYMRRQMLLALATHFGAADLRVVDSWIKDNGFDMPIKMLDEEATEAARRVHAAVEDAHRLSEIRFGCGVDSSDEDGPELEDLGDYDSEEDDDL